MVNLRRLFRRGTLKDDAVSGLLGLVLEPVSRGVAGEVMLGGCTRAA